jgi:hypothetical protein
MNGNLPVTVTISNGEEQAPITFHCSFSITARRLCQIACQLFGVNDNYYRLMFSDCELDDDLSLNDIDTTLTEFQFQLISTATVKSSVTYNGQTVTIPCSKETLASTIVEEIFQRFNIQQEHVHELLAMDTDQTQIDLEMSIEDILGLFPLDTTTIQLELRRKDD